MNRFFLTSAFLTLFLTGCSFPSVTLLASKKAGIFFSDNNGESFSSRSAIDEKKNLSKESILVLKVDPNDSARVYAGTEANGLFFSEDAGTKWRNLIPGKRIYGLVIDPRDNKRLFVAGVFDNQGKIKKSNDGGANWEDIYAEPAGSSVIASLEIDSYNPDTLYAGSSRGTLLKSPDQGRSWENIGELDGPIIKIALDSQETRDTYLLVFEKGVYKIDYSGNVKDRRREVVEEKSKNKLLNGVKIVDLKSKIPSKISAKGIMELKADPKKGKVIYLAGEGGLLRSEDGGETWKEIPTLEGSLKKTPTIRSLAIGGENSEILYFGAAGAFYHSFDAGVTWQAEEFKTKYAFESLAIDSKDPKKIYLGLRILK
jgi:photosystem II stability/assembly factor-like uncharacterized protein